MARRNLALDELDRMARDPRLRAAMMRQPELGFEDLATAPGVGLEEGPGFLPEFLGEVGRGIAATPETAATLATGALAFPLSGYAGLVGGPEAVTRAQEELIYQPRGETAQESVELAMKPIELAQDTSKWWGDKVEDATGSAEFGATVATMMEATFLVGIPEAIKIPAIKTTYRNRMAQLRANLKNAIRKDIRTGDTAYSKTSDILQQIVRESEEAGVDFGEVRRQAEQYKETTVSGEPGRSAINAEAQAAASTARGITHDLNIAREKMGVRTRSSRSRGNAAIDELQRMAGEEEAARRPVDPVRPTEERLTTRGPEPVVREPIVETTEWSAAQKVDGRSYQFRVGETGLSEVQHPKGRPFQTVSAAKTVTRTLKKNGIGDFEVVPTEGGFILREVVGEKLAVEGPLLDLPEFNNTGEALEFGAKATEEQIRLLEKRYEERLAEVDRLKAAGELDESFEMAFKSQFDREAIEVKREPGRYKAAVTAPAKPTRDFPQDPVTGSELTKFRVKPGGLHGWDVSNPAMTIEKVRKKITTDEGLPGIEAKDKITADIEKFSNTGYIVEGWDPKTKTWKWLDTLDTAKEAEQSAVRWNKEVGPSLKVVKPKRTATPEGISKRHGVEYVGKLADEFGEQYYRFYDPQVGKNGYREGVIDLPVEDLRTLKSEVDALRELNAEGARAEDLAAATISKETAKMRPEEAADSYRKWKDGDENVVIEDVEATIIDEINSRSPADFDTPTNHRAYVQDLEGVLSDIRRTKTQRKAEAPVQPRQFEHKPLTETETELFDQLKPEEIASLEEQMASEMREVGARGTDEVWSDIVDFFGEFDEGSLSFKPQKGGRKHYRLLSDEQKSAVLRIMQDARIAGVEVGKFLREKYRMADKDAAVIEGYIKEAMNERLKTPAKSQGSAQPASVTPYPPADETPIVKNPPTDKAVQEMPVTEREFGNVRDVPDLNRGQITAGLENPERTFRTLDDTLPGDPFKEMLYWKYQAAEKAIAVEWDNHYKPLIKELKSGLTWKQRKEIGAYAIAQQERGAEILGSMGVKKVPELSPAQMEVYRKLRGEFETFFDRINYVRQRIGKKPLKKVDNYFTFMRTFSLKDRMGASMNPILDKTDVILSAHKALKATPFRFARTRRKIGVLPVELDPFTVFEGYARSGLRHIHVSPTVAKVRALRTPFKNVPVLDEATGGMKSGSWHMQWKSPHLDEFLMKWSDHIAGVPSFKLPRGLERVFHQMNRNQVLAVLGANVRSALIQPSAMRNTVVEIGPTYSMRGIMSLFDPAQRNQMLQKSNVLTPRMFDAAVIDAQRVLGAGRVSEGQKVVANLAMKPLQVLDMQTARATWQGAYLLAKERLAMTERRAARYADDVVTRTQASAMAGDIAPIQRSAMGRWITLFQTFGINDWGYLTRDVMGITGSPTSPKVFKKAMGYIAATTAMNILFEDLLGVNSPFPTPIRSFSDALANGEDYPSASLRAAKELAEPIPLIGGGARYSSTPLGPNAQLLAETAALTELYPESLAPLMKSMNKSYYDLAGRWIGFPATSQIGKMKRAHRRGEGIYGTIMGSYTKKGRRKSSGMKELSGLKSL